jgi:hypothetical protein
LLWLAQVRPGADPLEWVGAMLLTGVGSAMPWGLMDGLAVSVVPTERAGMAAGIFSTVRVAGEAMVLAIVGALLAQGVLANLVDALPGPTSQTNLADAAYHLSLGQLDRAAALLGSVPRGVLVDAYVHTYARVLHVLAALTLMCACAVVWILRPPRRSALA